MTDKLKVIEYLKEKNISKRSFYEKTGFSNGFLDSGSSLGVDKLKIILENYPDFNIQVFLKDDEPLIVKQNISNTDSNINSNINGDVTGNITISHNDISKILELQKGSQFIQNELNERLKTSQNQINTLLEILKSK